MTHVASNRVVGDIPKSSHLFGDSKKFLEAHQKQMEFLKTAKREPIGLEHDGKDFYDSTALEAANRLKKLKEMGYRVPQYAIDALGDGCPLNA